MTERRVRTRWLTQDGGPDRLAMECLAAATAAPSIHNTQPWLFHLRPNGVDVSVDPDRQLTVIDLAGREQFISVGAALFNLRVAMVAGGRMPVCTLLPEGPYGPAARVAPGAPVTVTPAVRALSWAVTRRRSNRGPFRDQPVSARARAALCEAARREGALLRFADPATRTRVLELARVAERRWAADRAYRAELAYWVGERGGRRDGVPTAALGPRPTGDQVPLRDLGLHVAAVRPRVRFEEAPTLAVLYTGDNLRHWLIAGQALQRVLLTATVWGLATTLMTHPLEVPSLRQRLDDLRTGWPAQVIIRFGYACRPAAPSPRLPWTARLVERAPVG